MGQPARTIRRAVVTGGAGFLGSHLCEQLLDRDVEVVCLDNFLTGSPDNVAHLLERPGFRLVRCDVTDYVHVPGEVDLVLHFASPASPLDYLRMPIETLKVGSLGTLHTLGLAHDKGARYLLASTSEVYGDPLEHPQREDYWGNVNPVGPRGVYDEAKRFSEALTTAYRTSKGTDTGIVRIFNTYGPRMRADDGRAIPAFIGQALSGRPLTVAGDGSQTRSICYVEDTARGILEMAFSGHAGPVNIGNPDELSMLRLAEWIVELTGSSSPIEFIDLPVDDPKVRRPDTTRARELLSWRPSVSSEEGLRRTVDWFATRLEAAAVTAG
ncbi:NAD-dependent epimerase/dehydratase family protein [Modestobacter sp. I12A-02628]|uniref:SDR family oxidoreductase n=1 Tax=Goekera deserti TaxID=2497753 RepID=A0A7K3WGE8_9ACTN|nr:UDP-glucuronic acid decarboxylase family protein [Goekera deserti]MPQ97995.1 NAD-dependent epimerase/dehydratase family protein [Goekera deserti]NDI48642.1 NAD-dependent epimerase/dehydratase family protein [Goekera deserti]NEL54979.1 SDR family oxidoreductase [Goekera deserti]